MQQPSEGNNLPDDLSPLLLAASRGDGAAWREILNRYGRRVFALAKSRCKDSDVAEEITQSVFATVAAKLGSGEYNERGRFESWLFRVAMNRVRDHIRRLRRRIEINDHDTSSLRPAEPNEPQSDSSSLEHLRQAMDSLSDSDREIIELRHHGGLSFKQIADSLEEPIGTLLARHHRALRKLKEIMEAAATPREVTS